MTLCDAGPLIALLDKRDAAHQRIRQIIDTLRLPLITTWPAFTEAAYFLYASGGWAHQRELWNLVLVDQVLLLHTMAPTEPLRMRELMEQYRNVPMDLADASIVTAAEALRLRQILTLDSDFRIYRMADGRAFDLIPY